MKYTISEIQKRIMPTCKKYNITEIYLFGSYARNEATEESDIDLAINSAPIHGLLQLISFKNDVENALSVPVDVLTLRAIESEKDNSLKKEFFQNFNKERINLYDERY